MNSQPGQHGADGGKGGERLATPGGRGMAMAAGAAERVYGKHGGYRKLRAYQVAELLYDFTCRFCDRHIPKRDRHHDQMVQATRSGYQNIAEGSEDSATSKKLEMNLTNVARSSIDEARKDYLKYLVRRNLPVWKEGEPLFKEARNLRPATLEEAAAWVNRPGAKGRAEERAANLGAIPARNLLFRAADRDGPGRVPEKGCEGVRSVPRQV
jgi:four helix bundle protein